MVFAQKLKVPGLQWGAHSAPPPILPAGPRQTFVSKAKSFVFLVPSYFACQPPMRACNIHMTNTLQSGTLPLRVLT